MQQTQTKRGIRFWRIYTVFGIVLLSVIFPLLVKMLFSTHTPRIGGGRFGASQHKFASRNIPSENTIFVRFFFSAGLPNGENVLGNEVVVDESNKAKKGKMKQFFCQLHLRQPSAQPYILHFLWCSSIVFQEGFHFIAIRIFHLHSNQQPKTE